MAVSHHIGTLEQCTKNLEATEPLKLKYEVFFRGSVNILSCTLKMYGLTFLHYIYQCEYKSRLIYLPVFWQVKKILATFLRTAIQILFDKRHEDLLYILNGLAMSGYEKERVERQIRDMFYHIWNYHYYIYIHHKNNNACTSNTWIHVYMYRHIYCLYLVCC